MISVGYTLSRVARSRSWQSSFAHLMNGKCFFSTTDGDDSTAPSGTGQRRRRRRHRFDNIDEVPSFEVFQQKQKTKAMYREFLRLIYPLGEGDSREELLLQLRRQFRAHGTTPLSAWDNKRAHSEGSKRLKELSAMLGNAVDTSKKRKGRGAPEVEPEQKAKGQQQEEHQPSESTSSWPWQTQSIPKRPSPFPKKTGL